MDRTRLLADVLDRARANRAQGAEVLVVDSVGFQARATRGRVQRAVSTSEDRAVVRVWLEGGRGASVEGRADQALALVDKALAAAAKARPDVHAGPVGRTATEGDTSDIDDRRYENLTREDRLDVLATSERVARAVDRRFETSGFAYGDERVVRSFANTRGVRLREASTRFRVAGRVAAPSLGIELEDVVEDRAFATVASLPFGASLARRLVALHGERIALDGPYRVMLPPRVVAEIVALLAPHFERRRLEGGTSFLARARSDGGLVLSPRLHLVDDGRLPGALRSRSFDDRGVSPVPLTLIRDGQVDGWYLDVAEARLLDVRPTGHLDGDSLVPGNLVVRGGTRSMNALLSEQDVPVLVLDHLRGLEKGLDVLTGRLDCEASGRLVVPRNKTAGWAPFMTLSGDLTEVLASVVDLASDTDRHLHVDAPGMLVDGFQARTIAGPPIAPQ